MEDNKDFWRRRRCQLQYSQLGTLYKAGIVEDMVIPLENAHLHHAKAELEDAVNGVIVDGVENVVEDEEGGFADPQGPTHAMLVPLEPVGPAAELQ